MYPRDVETLIASTYFWPYSVYLHTHTSAFPNTNSFQGIHYMVKSMWTADCYTHMQLRRSWPVHICPHIFVHIWMCTFGSVCGSQHGQRFVDIYNYDVYILYTVCVYMCNKHGERYKIWHLSLWQIFPSCPRLFWLLMTSSGERWQQIVFFFTF